ncbi:MAG: EamA family transporter [Desulfobacterales bacterium]|nr:EamA family transporter [Desulfobacterales bacterium]
MKKSENKVLRSKDLLPVIALGAAVLFWGSSFVATRVAVSAIHPQGVMLCRMLIACLVMLPFAKKLMPRTWDPGDLKLLVPMVLLQPCLYYLLESNALKLTTSSQAGVISASVPVLVGLGAWLFLSERISVKTVVGLAISVAGVIILTLGGRDAAPGDNPLLGNSLEFGAMICAAGGMLILKILIRKYNPWFLTGLQFLAGAVFFSPGIRHITASPELFLQADVLLSVIFLGVFASVAAFGLYNWAMSQVPASKAAIFINLVPVVAVILGWTILGESFTPVQTAGAVMVAAGVLTSQNLPKFSAGERTGRACRDHS